MSRRILVLIGIGLIAALALRTFVIEGVYVASTSMEPTLRMGTSFLLEKVTYMFRSPARQDIVVFPSPVTGDYDLIKRVIAVGGDTLEIREKEVFLNGKRLEEPYVKHTRRFELLVGDNLGPLAVPENTFFVMGDNRDESEDSRDWKDKKTGEPLRFIPRSSIKGKLIFFY